MDDPLNDSGERRNAALLSDQEAEQSLLLGAVRVRSERRRRHVRDGGGSFAIYLGQIGMLGWAIVVPALVGLFAGRWLDHRFATGIFWSIPLMLVGVVFGCWSAWKWMHRA